MSQISGEAAAELNAKLNPDPLNEGAGYVVLYLGKGYPPFHDDWVDCQVLLPDEEAARARAKKLARLGMRCIRIEKR